MSLKHERKIPLRPYTLKELAILYGVNKRTFKAWLKPHEEEIGEHDGWYYLIPQVKIIFARLGLPATLIDD